MSPNIFLLALPHCGITHVVLKNFKSSLAFQVYVGLDVFSLWILIFIFLNFILVSLTNADTHFLSIFFKKVNKCND